MRFKFAYKIKIIYIVCLFFNLHLFTTAFAQPKVVKKLKEYWQIVKEDSLQKMVEVKSAAPAIVYDLRYATENNFMHYQLYKSGKHTFLRLPVVKALAQIEKELKKQGYGLKIFDAYRPYSVTKKMWDLIHDDRYVADPSKGSGHNRGLAVDLTIIRLADGKELNMGTGFDNFTDSAHHSFKNFPGEVLQNRKLLREIMEKYGFKPLETEWWHYAWPNDRNYEVLDIDFKKLEKKSY